MFYQPIVRHDEEYIARILTVTDFPAHWHSELELLYIHKGTHQVMVNHNNSYILHSGEYIVIPGNMVHSLILDNHTANHPKEGAMSIEIGYSFLGNDFNGFTGRYFPSPVFSVNDPADGLSKDILSLWELLRAERDYKKSKDAPGLYKTRWNIKSVLFHVAGILLEQSEPIPSKDREILPDVGKISTILDFISTGFSQDITVDDAAALVGYDKFYFCKKFKKSFGVSFHDFLNCYRINMACNYVCDTNLSLSEISGLTGFSSGKQFSKIFKLYTGVTPTVYRNQDPALRQTVVPLRVYDNHDRIVQSSVNEG